MSEMLQELQYKLKSSTGSLALFIGKVVSGMILGLTLALIFEQIVGFGQLAFLFIIVAVTGAFVRVSKGWQFIGLAVFDLICVLVGLLLRMYILVAPGS